MFISLAVFFSSMTTEVCDDVKASKTKQQKKEEGRLRALEISMAKQNTNNTNVSNNNKRGNRKSVRHGARNQHRHKNFAKWILDTFGKVLEESSIVKEVDGTTDTFTQQQMHILDVAGGKGELSSRLSLCHSQKVVMIDPRPADIESVYLNSVVPKLPKKWQESIKDKLKLNPSFVQDLIDDRFTQLVMPFTSPYQSIISLDDEKVNSYTDAKLDEAVKNATLIIGLHSDGATEAIVDAALLYKKPFVVVPCCVFPNLFHERYISTEMNDATDDTILYTRERQIVKDASTNQEERQAITEKRVPVRTHDQFCKYLLAKDPRFVKEILPFDGRNVAIWWDGT